MRELRQQDRVFSLAGSNTRSPRKARSDGSSDANDVPDMSFGARVAKLEKTGKEEVFDEWPQNVPLIPLIDVDQNLVEQLWQYQDDYGSVQGPFNAADIVSWINDGYFDGRGDIPFRKVGEIKWQHLEEALTRIIRGEYVEARYRIKEVESEEEDLESKHIPLYVEPEMSIPLNLERPELTDVDIKQMYKSSATCDVDVIIHPQLRRPHDSHINFPRKIISIPAHCNLLKMASPFLLHKLDIIEDKHKQQERLGMPVGKRMKFEITTKNPEAIRVIIRWIYGFTFETVNCDPLLLLSVLRESHRLQIPALVKLCEKSATPPKDIDTILKMAIISDELKLYDLRDEAVTMLCDCSYALFSCSRHLVLTLDMMKRILSSDHVMLDELQIVLAAQAFASEKESTLGIFSKKFY